MVDFSRPDEVKRWLDKIEPAERRREVAVALAARAALRVLPLLGRQGEVLPALVLPCLRAAALSWVAARYPTRRDALRTAAEAALHVAGLAALRFHALTDDTTYSAAVATNNAAAAVYGNVDAAAVANAIVNVAAVSAACTRSVSARASRTRATSVSARATATRTTSGSARARAVSVATRASSNPATSVSTRVRSARAGYAYTSASAARDDADAHDAAQIDSGRSGAELARMPLWPNGAAGWASEAWQKLKGTLLATDQGWEVWTDWYEARLAGDAARPPTEALEFARATIPDEIWKQGPAVVNAEIKRLINEHQSLQQRPAAFQFRVVDDKIDALPDDARPLDPETARDFYDETKRKGQDLRDRLQRAQVDENIRAHVDLLLTRLGSSYADMRSGLMISVLRSLESDVRAYEGEEGRKELSAAHLSNVIDLAESVRDLCAIFPRSREIEAEAVSLALPMQRMPEIREAIGSVVAKINASDGATEGGRAAINASTADLANQRSLAEETKQSAYFLVDFANFTRAGVKHLKATGRAVGGEIAGLGADSWRAVRRGAPKGLERGAAQAGKALVVGGVAALMHWLGSDIAALGTMVGPYLPLHEMLEKITGAAPGASAAESDASPASAEDADDAPAPRAPKARKSKARKPGKT